MTVKSFGKAHLRAVSDEYISITDCGMSGAVSDSELPFVPVIEKGGTSYSIVFVEKGDAAAVIGNSVLSAVEGSVVLFYPENPRNIILKGRTSVYRYVDFVGYAIPEILAQCGFSESGVFRASSAAGVISDTMARIMLAFGRRAPVIRINSLFMHLLADISVSESAGVRDTHSDISCFEKILKVRTLMDAEYRSARKISEYAKICSMSCGRFSAVFEKAIGKTPKKYIEDMKIDKACELLRHTAMTVTAAAQNSGFSDSLYFSRVFRRRFGMSPTEYRNLLP